MLTLRRRDDDRERGPRFPDALQQRDSIRVRQSHIQHQDVGSKLLSCRMASAPFGA